MTGEQQNAKAEKKRLLAERIRVQKQQGEKLKPAVREQQRKDTLLAETLVNFCHFSNLKRLSNS